MECQVSFGCAAALWSLDREARPLIEHGNDHELPALYFGWLDTAAALIRQVGVGKTTRLPVVKPIDDLVTSLPFGARLATVQRCLDALRAAARDPSRASQVFELASEATEPAFLDQVVALGVGGASRPFEADTALARSLKRRPGVKDRRVEAWSERRRLALPHVVFHNNSGGIRGALLARTSAEHAGRGAFIRTRIEDELQGEWDEMDDGERRDWLEDDLGDAEWRALSWFDTLHVMFSERAGNHAHDLLVDDVPTSLPQLLSSLGPFAGGAAGRYYRVFEFRDVVWVEQDIV